MDQRLLQNMWLKVTCGNNINSSKQEQPYHKQIKNINSTAKKGNEKFKYKL